MNRTARIIVIALAALAVRWIATAGALVAIPMPMSGWFAVCELREPANQLTKFGLRCTMRAMDTHVPHPAILR